MRLRNPFARLPATPEWCAFFSPKEYAHFEELVLSAFAKQGIAVTQDEDGAVLVSQLGNFGLVNIAKVCRACSQDLWPEQISEHFERAFASLKDSQLPDRRFEDVADILVARLYDATSDVAQQTSKIVFREHIPGTITTLNLELPTAFRSVSEEVVHGWGIDREALLSSPA